MREAGRRLPEGHSRNTEGHWKRHVSRQESPKHIFGSCPSCSKWFHSKPLTPSSTTGSSAQEILSWKDLKPSNKMVINSSAILTKPFRTIHFAFTILLKKAFSPLSAVSFSSGNMYWVHMPGTVCQAQENEQELLEWRIKEKAVGWSTETLSEFYWPTDWPGALREGTQAPQGLGSS